MFNIVRYLGQTKLCFNCTLFYLTAVKSTRYRNVEFNYITRNQLRYHSVTIIVLSVRTVVSVSLALDKSAILRFKCIKHNYNSTRLNTELTRFVHLEKLSLLPLNTIFYLLKCRFKRGLHYAGHLYIRRRYTNIDARSIA